MSQPRVQALTAWRALVQSVDSVDCSSGFLVIAMRAIVENPMLSGFEITSAVGATPAPSAAATSAPTIGTDVPSAAPATAAPSMITDAPTVAAATNAPTAAAPTASPTLSPTPGPGGALVSLVRINLGSTGAFTDPVTGAAWQASDTFVRGAPSQRAAAVTVAGAGSLNAVYASYAFWTASMTVASPALEMPLPNGAYTLRLHFANTFGGTATPGTRVFDVVAEGVVVLPAFDIVAAAGGTLRATARDVPVTVTDGALSVAVRKIVDNPQLNGLEILGASTLQRTQQIRMASPLSRFRKANDVSHEHIPRARAATRS